MSIQTQQEKATSELASEANISFPRDGMAVDTLSTDSLLTMVVESLRTIGLFTKDDFYTFVVPNTIFGVSAALSGRLMAGHARNLSAVLPRLPFVVFFNWSNLLIFDLANQRLPESIEEDRFNKPWRPLPAGRISQRQTRHLMITIMPIVVLLNSLLSVWKETALLFTLTWIYNDLKGGDDNWLVRNIIIAFAFFLYNLGSLKVAIGASEVSVSDPVSSAAYGWTAIISAVIVTTMQVQDLKDQIGDSARGRQTAPLVLGELIARRTIAIPVLFWSFACALVWGLWVLPVAVGSYVAYRVLWKRGVDDDRRSWKLWCLWTAILYLLPLLSGFSTSGSFRFCEICSEGV